MQVDSNLSNRVILVSYKTVDECRVLVIRDILLRLGNYFDKRTLALYYNLL